MAKRKATTRKAARKPAEVYQLYVVLLESDPPIWRSVAVPGDMPLSKLHDVIQVLMGWTDSHLHQFTGPDEMRYSLPEFELDEVEMNDVGDERKTYLNEIVADVGDRFLYEYDFGDSWEVGLEVEKVTGPEPGQKYPVCLAGELAGPPDDCGGIYGFYELLEALKKPKNKQHKEMQEWLEGIGMADYDPQAFDIDEINRDLRSIR